MSTNEKMQKLVIRIVKDDDTIDLDKVRGQRAVAYISNPDEIGGNIQNPDGTVSYPKNVIDEKLRQNKEYVEEQLEKKMDKANDELTNGEIDDLLLQAGMLI